MVICYVIVVTCYSLCHRRSVYFWRDSSVLRGSSGIRSRPHHHRFRKFIPRRCRRRPLRLRTYQQHRSDLTTWQRRSLSWPPRIAVRSTLLTHVRRVSALPGNTDDGADLGIESRTEDDPAAIIDGSQTVLWMQFLWFAVMLILLSIHRQLKPCRLADRLVCPMNDDGATATKVRQRLLHSCLHLPYLCHAAALSPCSFA